MSLSPERVQSAVTAWRWVPDGARRQTNDELDAVEFPDDFHPSMQVYVGQARRSPAELVQTITDLMDEWGKSEVGCWLTPQTPPDYEAAIRALPGQVGETVDILAYDLTESLPTVTIPTDVAVEVVTDERTMRGADLVATEVWGSDPPTPTEVRERLQALDAELSRGTFRVVAFVDGAPASTGGCTVVGDVARLWGACTVSHNRRRGAYRAVLLERLRAARRYGAEFALVTARAHTSSSILQRTGFQQHGSHHCYVHRSSSGN